MTMQEIPPVPDSPRRYSLWACLTSSNWWWYGDVNPPVLPPPEKRPRFWRPEMIFSVVFGLALLVYPAILSFLNYSIPLDAELLTLRGQVVGVNKKSPHMQVKLANGETVSADFPVTSVFGPMEQRKFFDYMQRDLILKCKDVEITGQYLLYMPIDRFRIWEFKCMNKSYLVGREAIRRNWLKDRELGLKVHVTGTFAVFIILMGCNFIREKRDHGIKG